MIKGFLLAFDVILIVMFLIGMIFGIKTKEKGMGLLSGSISLIITLNSLFILNLQDFVRCRIGNGIRKKSKALTDKIKKGNG